MLRHLLMICFLLPFSLPAQSCAEDASYLRYAPDLPLMSGMTELSDQSMVFDKAEGRVVETAVFTAVSSVDEVQDFYRTTLPALGWQRLSSDRFLRNGEQLLVKCEKVQDGVVVRFSLSPKQGPTQGKNY